MFIKPRRDVRRVFLHCSAADDPALRADVLVDTVRRWHRARGFKDIGYHFLIDKQANLMVGRDIEQTPAAQKGHNLRTIAIMVHGLEDFTLASLDRLVDVCAAINGAYEGRISFHGHREVNASKTCPVFNYKALLALDRWGRMP